MPEGIDAERKSLGLTVRSPDPMQNVQGDNELFKYALITPKEPFTVATFEREYTEFDKDGKPVVKKESMRRNVPQLVSTMALGNLNTKEVALARLFAEMSRMCSWHGYYNLAIDYYLKLVHLNVTSQAHQMQLLQQILTETVSVHRKEESMAGTRDYSSEKTDKFKEFIDKWKQKDAAGSSLTGQGAQGYQNMGLR